MRGVSIKFNNDVIHTGDDYNLVQEVKTIEPPEVQSYLVEVPGRNGLVNLTKGLTGFVNYNNRKITLQYFASGKRQELQDLLDMFYRYHGEVIEIIDDDTPDFHYSGECTVSHAWGTTYLQIKLEINANPFRQALYDTCLQVALSDDIRPVYVDNPGVAITPIVTVENTAQIVKDNVKYTFTKGVYELTDIVLTHGLNEFMVNGSGQLEIKYKEAML